MSVSREQEMEARRQAQNAEMEVQNARVLAWIEQTKGVTMSWRARTDGWAAVMRPQNIKMLEGAERMGWIPEREVRAATIQAALCECGFYDVPKSGWPSFCYELDLIFIAMPDRVDESNKGHAALAKQLEHEADAIEKAQRRFQELSCSMDYLWAESQCGEQGSNWKRLNDVKTSLRKIAVFLKERPQPARWRNAAQRKFRVDLATKVSTIFELEFGEEAKPVGGSAARELDETNRWTKFFQGCALILMNERASPDRQAILWEAFSNSTVSDIRSEDEQ